MSKSRERSEVVQLVTDVRRLYSQVRTMERQINRFSRVMETLGIGAFPAFYLIGPYSFLFLFISQIATAVAQKIAEETARKQIQIEREEERRLRESMLREAYRGIVSE